MGSQPARVISITSGKGGVGKTSTTINLALSLSKLGKNVLILDADLGLANVNVMLGFEPNGTIKDVVSGKADIKDVVYTHHLGIDILPATSGIPEMALLDEQSKSALIGAVDELGYDYDYLLVDTGAGIGSNVMYFNVAAEEVVVVVDEEPTSRTDAYALIKVLNQNHGIKEFSIVANRSPRGNDGKNVYAQLAAACDRFLHVRLKFLGSISEDSSVREAVLSQEPFTELYPSSRASLDISRIAKKLVEEEGSRKPKGGVQFFFRALLENQ